jgi:hypothetical protein
VYADGVVPTQTVPWPKGIIPYYIDSKTIPGHVHNLILNGIKSINQKTNVHFRPYRQGDKNYLVIGFQKNGCFSRKVGMDSYRNDNFVNLSTGCWTHRTVVHELCHAIGLNHEHKHPYRDQYLDFVYTQTDFNDRSFNYNILQYYQSVLNPLPFNPQSIMLYASGQIKSNGKGHMTIYENYYEAPTVSYKPNVGAQTPGVRAFLAADGKKYFWIPKNNRLSQGDIQSINDLYQWEVQNRAQDERLNIQNQKQKIKQQKIEIIKLSKGHNYHSQKQKVMSVAGANCKGYEGQRHTSFNSHFSCYCQYLYAHEKYGSAWHCYDITEGQPYPLVGNYKKVNFSSYEDSRVLAQSVHGRVCQYKSGGWMANKYPGQGLDPHFSCICQGNPGNYRYRCSDISNGSAVPMSN